MDVFHQPKHFQTQLKPVESVNHKLKAQVKRFIPTSTHFA